MNSVENNTELFVINGGADIDLKDKFIVNVNLCDNGLVSDENNLEKICEEIYNNIVSSPVFAISIDNDFLTYETINISFLKSVIHYNTNETNLTFIDKLFAIISGFKTKNNTNINNFKTDYVDGNNEYLIYQKINFRINSMLCDFVINSELEYSDYEEYWNSH